MAYFCHLLDLPDLVLHNICTYVTDPFDLLHFGNTCTRLRRIASAPSLWWSIAFQWCEGLWMHISTSSAEKHPREWLLEVLREITILPSGTELKCTFSNGEDWERIDSRKFRCIFGLLRLAYKRHKDDHPAVLYEQWLYDIGLYRRVNAQTDFTRQNSELSEDIILQLAHLGQAVDRDLRRRKQPNKDPRYYIKRIATSEVRWMSELFPSGPHGSICPLLICPFQDSVTNEVSGIQGLSVCLSVVLSKCLKEKYKTSFIPLKDIPLIIKTFCTLFIQDLMSVMPEMESRFGSISLKSAVLTLVQENTFNVQLLQSVFTLNGINLSCKDVLREFSNFLKKREGIDMIVDKVRSRIRVAMFGEINRILFENNLNKYTVTRINLTDSDFIGGDNSRQEMSAAAFISESGVLVSWHLTGRMRF